MGRAHALDTSTTRAAPQQAKTETHPVAETEAAASSNYGASSGLHPSARRPPAHVGTHPSSHLDLCAPGRLCMLCRLLRQRQVLLSPQCPCICLRHQPAGLQGWVGGWLGRLEEGRHQRGCRKRKYEARGGTFTSPTCLLACTTISCRGLGRHGGGGRVREEAG